MESVVFTEDGLFIKQYKQKEKREYYKRPKKAGILTYLRMPCEIDDGTILLDIVKAVERYEYLKIFISQYSQCEMINEFHQCASQITNESCGLDYLTVGWGVKSFEVKNVHVEGLRPVDYELAVDFWGVGKGPDICIDMVDQDGQVVYDVGLTPFDQLIKLPVYFDTRFTVYEPHDAEEGKPLFTANRQFSLLEVLDAIYDSISLFGGPRRQQTLIDSLTATAGGQCGGVSIAFVPLEQVIKRIGDDSEMRAELDKLIAMVGCVQDNEESTLLHPDLVRELGINPDEIPLDDKYISRADGK